MRELNQRKAITPLLGLRMLASSGQGQQANVSQMDWSGPKRAAHPNTGRERINLMEVAKDFFGGVEFAADVQRRDLKTRA